jgi:hypothetical protein
MSLDTMAPLSDNSMIKLPAVAAYRETIQDVINGYIK